MQLSENKESFIQLIISVDHLLQLHGQSANSFGSWLGLEHAWLLLGEVDLRAGRAGFLLSFNCKVFGFIAAPEHLEFSSAKEP